MSDERPPLEVLVLFESLSAYYADLVLHVFVFVTRFQVSNG